MIIIVAVDDNNGMMFNKRRQSQDRILREKIIKMAKDSRLWMNSYTYKQFNDIPGQITVDDDFLSKASVGEYCFVENAAIAPYEKQIEKIILFKWNRKYPSDFRFDIDLSSQSWKLSETEDFVGSSHEKITKETYIHA